MPKFDVTIAHSVQCYATVEIEADNLAGAIQRVRDDKERLLFAPCHPDWETSDDYRIVEVLDEDEDVVAEAIDVEVG